MNQNTSHLMHVAGDCLMYTYTCFWCCIVWSTDVNCKHSVSNLYFNVCNIDISTGFNLSRNLQNSTGMSLSFSMYYQGTCCGTLGDNCSRKFLAVKSGIVERTGILDIKSYFVTNSCLFFTLVLSNPTHCFLFFLSPRISVVLEVADWNTRFS